MTSYTSARIYLYSTQMPATHVVNWFHGEAFIFIEILRVLTKFIAYLLTNFSFRHKMLDTINMLMKNSLSVQKIQFSVAKNCFQWIYLFRENPVYYSVGIDKYLLFCIVSSFSQEITPTSSVSVLQSSTFRRVLNLIDIFNCRELKTCWLTPSKFDSIWLINWLTSCQSCV